MSVSLASPIASLAFYVPGLANTEADTTARADWAVWVQTLDLTVILRYELW